MKNNKSQNNAFEEFDKVVVSLSLRVRVERPRRSCKTCHDGNGETGRMAENTAFQHFLVHVSREKQTNCKSSRIELVSAKRIDFQL